MRRRRRFKFKSLFILLILIGIGYFGYTLYKDKLVNKESPPKFMYEDILTKIGEKYTDVDTFYIYGKYLNLKGILPDTTNEYEVIFKNNEEEIKIPTINEEGRFSTNKYINDGINLENLKKSTYIMLLCDKKEEKTCYHLVNKTDYHDNKYYTMTNTATKTGKNNLITFNEEKYQNYKYWTINIVDTKLPDDVYDVVIDPGHGGVDTGAGNGKYNESTFTLDYSKTLKEELEREGLKVKLTRETDEGIEHYGEGSRTGIAYESNAKLYLAIHLNSSGSKIQKGVEIYRAYEDNNDYAKLLADNIVKYANQVYSNNPQNKIMDGVYMRVYSKENIASLIKEAKRDGYEPYDFTDHETYYYFVRETGGIMTHAFTDGRNPKFKANPYRNRNQGTEAYLCELAYISQSDDLNSILNNKEGYIKALKQSILSYAEMQEKTPGNN